MSAPTATPQASVEGVTTQLATLAIDWDDVVRRLSGCEPIKIPYDWKFLVSETFDDLPDYELGTWVANFSGFHSSSAVRMRGWVFCAQRVTEENARLLQQTTGEVPNFNWFLVAYKDAVMYSFRIQFIRLNNAAVEKVILQMFAPYFFPHIAAGFDENERVKSKSYRDAAFLKGDESLVFDLSEGEKEEGPRCPVGE